MAYKQELWDEAKKVTINASKPKWFRCYFFAQF